MRHLTTYKLLAPIRRTTHYSLLTIHYSLLTTHYSLLTIHYSVLTTHYSLFTTHYSQDDFFTDERMRANLATPMLFEACLITQYIPLTDHYRLLAITPDSLLLTPSYLLLTPHSSLPASYSLLLTPCYLLLGTYSSLLTLPY